ncbi:hypothetical protein [Desulfolucanica intricata]|uniref:hypothetical protein n=1 Tax=Desulfolucanica intricata TaxID=1285191 RepID=UPI000832E25C|nr:hypothetical protein [Desulfolucanica intricata]
MKKAGFWIIIAALLSIMVLVIVKNPGKVAISSPNLYQIDFNKDWNSIQEKLNINPSEYKIQDYNLEFEKDGSINRIQFQLIGTSKSNFIHYWINFKPTDKNTYEIKRTKIESWLQFDRLISADKFFKVMHSLNFNEMMPEGKYDWYQIDCSGELSSYGVEENQKYLITDKTIKQLSNGDLPIKGYYISVFGMAKTTGTKDVTRYEGKGYKDYFFEIVP